MFFSRKPGLQYVHRGDPVDYDVTKGNITCDYTWRELDLSSIVPANAKLADITVTGSTSNAGYVGILHDKYGAVNHNLLFYLATPVAVGLFSGNFIIDISSNGKILYKVATTCTLYTLTVRGWWI